jgi:hypothetical protein
MLYGFISVQKVSAVGMRSFVLEPELVEAD